MKRIIFFLLVIGFLLFPFACEKDKIDFNHSFKLSSPVTGFEYNIQVFQTGGTGQEYVFFVLDSKDLMPIIKKQIEKLNPATSVTFVGIEYPGSNNRTRDYTISKRGKETGMASQFLQFIQVHLDSTLIAKGIYDTNSSRGIIGHSLGGLFCSYGFSIANNFFDNYLILSPALFWDDYHYFAVEQDTRINNHNSKASVFLGIGEAEDLGMNNIYEQFGKLLITEYPGVSLQTNVAEGSHFYSRDANIYNGLKHLLNL